MTQDTDLMAAVNQEMSDIQELLAKLAAMPAVQIDPVLEQAITDLQNSHTQIQAVLNPTPTPTSTPTPVVATS